jgi:hypothetical protein
VARRYPFESATDPRSPSLELFAHDLARYAHTDMQSQRFPCKLRLSACILRTHSLMLSATKNSEVISWLKQSFLM